MKVDARIFRWVDVTDRGRPSSKDLVRQEAQRRCEAGEIEPTLKTFAAGLEDWLKKEHPDQPSLCADRIAREVSDIRRRHLDLSLKKD
jgi:hypothetical protein